MAKRARQRNENTIFRLVQAPEELICGKQLQVTRFHPLSKICTGGDGYAFVAALLARVRKEVVTSGNSPLRVQFRRPAYP